MSAHTPGPWGTDEKDHDCPYQDIRIMSGSRGICKIWMDDAPVEDFNRQQCANARLIAAAPDMLAALQSIVKWQGIRGTDDQLLAAEKQPPDVCYAMQAIAKATGSQS